MKRIWIASIFWMAMASGAAGYDGTLSFDPANDAQRCGLPPEGSRVLTVRTRFGFPDERYNEASLLRPAPVRLQTANGVLSLDAITFPDPKARRLEQLHCVVFADGATANAAELAVLRVRETIKSENGVPEVSLTLVEQLGPFKVRGLDWGDGAGTVYRRHPEVLDLTAAEAPEAVFLSYARFGSSERGPFVEFELDNPGSVPVRALRASLRGSSAEFLPVSYTGSSQRRTVRLSIDAAAATARIDDPVFGDFEETTLTFERFGGDETRFTLDLGEIGDVPAHDRLRIRIDFKDEDAGITDAALTLPRSYEEIETILRRERPTTEGAFRDRLAQLDGSAYADTRVGITATLFEIFPYLSIQFGERVVPPGADVER